MFQLLGVELVRMAKTRFGGRRKKQKSAVDPFLCIRISDTLHVSICFFSDKALGRCRTEKNIPHIYDSAPDMKNALHFQSCPNLCTGNFQFSVMGRMAGQ